MIVVRGKDDPVAAALGIGAILLLAGSLGFMLLAKKPSVESTVNRIKDDTFKAQLAAKKAEDATAEADKYISTHAWDGTADVVAPSADRKSVV